MVNLGITRQAQCLSLLFLITTGLSGVHAADFVTIIGPDGRPLVVPVSSKDSKSSTQNKTHQAHVSENNQQMMMPNAVLPSAVSSINSSAQVKMPESANKTEAATPSSAVLKPPALAQNQSSIASLATTNAVNASSVDGKELKNIAINDKAIKDSGIVKPKPEQTQQKISIEPISPSSAKVMAQPPATNVSSNQVKQRSENTTILSIDGQQYVNSEYLEDKEFNLEGKKRFYVMPDGVAGNRAGGARFETIEREKGVNISFLNQLLKPKPEQNLALALSDQYFRMSKAEVEQSLEQSCFSGKKFKKPKKIDQDGVLELVATPPIKDIFDYELVKIASPIENIKLTSYSTSDRVQQYYWPLVVFLNENGCVIEAAGGFKTQQLAATMRQHSAIEGLITLPQQTRYVLLTPLASAVDVDDKSLTNQGQIKLTAIR